MLGHVCPRSRTDGISVFGGGWYVLGLKGGNSIRMQTVFFLVNVITVYVMV